MEITYTFDKENNFFEVPTGISMKGIASLDKLVTTKSEIKGVIDDYGTFVLDITSLKKTANLNLSMKLGAHATLIIHHASLAPGIGSITGEINLAKPGSYFSYHLSSMTDDVDKKVVALNVIHNASETKSEIHAHGVALGESTLNFAGVSHIKKGMKNCEARQKENIIAFDSKVKTSCSPVLKIDNNDVVASHGATLGKVDDEALFYLESRGLSESEAKILIIKGFLTPYFNEFEDEETKKSLFEILNKKVIIK